MKKRDFKVGDKVRYIKDLYGWSEFAGVELGEVYTIKSISRSIPQLDPNMPKFEAYLTFEGKEMGLADASFKPMNKKTKLWML